jgi:hypothetical protein
MPKQSTAIATVAISKYAASTLETVDGETEKPEPANTPKLAPNGRYLQMSESGIHSEKGGEYAENARPVPETTRILYDYPRNPTFRHEMYRRAHPTEVSKPMEFTAYLRIAKPTNMKHKELRFHLPTVEELTETLQALYIPTKTSPRQEETMMGNPHTDKTHLTEEDIPRLRQQWYDEFRDIMQGIPETLPCFRKSITR